MSSISAEAGLTISAVAARTGVSVPVLRAWEQRHGFPRPERLPGGHRRYGEQEVARIERVLRERAEGRSLEAAIDLVLGSRAGTDVDDVESIFAGLRRHRPDLEVHVLSRRAMLAVSRAIEDECRAWAERAHLTAAFQRGDGYRKARRRWQELATTAASAVAFGPFRRRDGAGRGIVGIDIVPTSALQREWAVVCDAPGSSAALAGWERPDGRFEALWTVEPAAVRTATDVGRMLARRRGVELPEPPALLALDAPAALRRAVAITNRVVANLDESWRAPR